jgi:hypothetical protein
MPRSLVGSRSLVRLALVVTLFASAARPAMGQGVFFSPTFGVFIPSNELANLASGAKGTYKLDVAFNVGLRLGLWFGSRVGMMATGDYSPTSISFDSAGTVRQSDVTTFAGTGRLMFYLIPRKDIISLMLSGGVSVNAYSPKSFSSKADYTDLGGVVGATLGIRLGRVVGLTINADDNIYQASFTPTGSSSSGSAPTQHDIRLTAGIHFGG